MTKKDYLSICEKAWEEFNTAEEQIRQQCEAQIAPLRAERKRIIDATQAEWQATKSKEKKP